MITTVCLNPAIDQSAELERLYIGGTNRLNNLRSQIGGKGVNIAVVLKRLQAEVQCLCIMGHADTAFFAQGMENEGIPFHAVAVSGSVRRNLKVIETKSRTVTELNQQGAEAGVDALKEITGMLSKHTDSTGFTALCGSLPPGCERNVYQTLMQTYPGRQWAVDTSGDAMRYALNARPYLIKPNHAELEEIVGNILPDTDAIKNAAVSLCKKGVRYVAVSLGEQGALITDGIRTVYAPAIPVTVKFTVGAGDSMLAGILYGIGRGETALGSLQYGIAAAAACVEGGSIHAFTKWRFEELLEKAITREI